MRFCLRALHMPLVQRAFGPGGNQNEQASLAGCCQAILELMRFPDLHLAPALQEYGDLAQLFARLTQPGQPLATKQSSNREIWGHCLGDEFLEKHFPGRALLHIPDLIRYYQSSEDGSCGVERGLAWVRAFIDESLTQDIEVLDDLAVLVNAELQAAYFARKRFGIWEPGAFGLECGALWREVIGACMGIYHTAPKNSILKQGTFKCVKAGVLKAIGAVTVANGIGQPLAAQQPCSLATALAARSVTAGAPRSPHWTKGFHGSGFAIQNVMCVGIWALPRVSLGFLGGLLRCPWKPLVAG